MRYGKHPKDALSSRSQVVVSDRQGLSRGDLWFDQYSETPLVLIVSLDTGYLLW